MKRVYGNNVVPNASHQSLASTVVGVVITSVETVYVCLPTPPKIQAWTNLLIQYIRREKTWLTKLPWTVMLDRAQGLSVWSPPAIDLIKA